jgi:hypothetical protein
MGMILKFQSKEDYFAWINKYKLAKGNFEVYIGGQKFNLNHVMWKKGNKLPINMNKVTKRL